MTCQVALGLDAEAGALACGASAPYLALDWGHGPGREETACCQSHAYEAHLDGAVITDEHGNVIDFEAVS